jgi:carbonic anhydrase/acetyltransferase-like protein (isoleucine patch superfamily)
VLRPYREQLPRVHSTAYVDDSAQVIGDVEIGEESSVWMCVVIRGDVHRIRIGRRTNVQDGSVVHVMKDAHPTIIGDNVTIGHAAVVHGCTVEDQCLIGMGAILLNGAHVGTQSIVAAGTLLTEGHESAVAVARDGEPWKSEAAADPRRDRGHSGVRRSLRILST